MMARKMTPDLIRVIIVVVVIGSIPFLKPSSGNEDKKQEPQQNEIITEDKIVVLTDEPGREVLLNKIISFRKKNPKVGIVLVFDDRAVPVQGPDICMIKPESGSYTEIGSCFINKQQANNMMVLEFAETINQK